jgi:hypothetical protein
MSSNEEDISAYNSLYSWLLDAQPSGSKVVNVVSRLNYKEAGSFVSTLRTQALNCLSQTTSSASISADNYVVSKSVVKVFVIMYSSILQRRLCSVCGEITMIIKLLTSQSQTRQYQQHTTQQGEAIVINPVTCHYFAARVMEKIKSIVLHLGSSTLRLLSENARYHLLCISHPHNILKLAAIFP